MINNMHRFSVPKKTAFHLGFVIMLVKCKLKGSACSQHNDWLNIWSSAKWSLIYCHKNIENFAPENIIAMEARINNLDRLNKNQSLSLFLSFSLLTIQKHHPVFIFSAALLFTKHYTLVLLICISHFPTNVGYSLSWHVVSTQYIFIYVSCSVVSDSFRPHGL